MVRTVFSLVAALLLALATARPALPRPPPLQGVVVLVDSTGQPLPGLALTGHDARFTKMELSRYASTGAARPAQRTLANLEAAAIARGHTWPEGASLVLLDVLAVEHGEHLIEERQQALKDADGSW